MIPIITPPRLVESSTSACKDVLDSWESVLKTRVYIVNHNTARAVSGKYYWPIVFLKLIILVVR